MEDYLGRCELRFPPRKEGKALPTIHEVSATVMLLSDIFETEEQEQGNDQTGCSRLIIH
jgi:hypothetical protein